jgi:hypothetical protein
MIMQAIMSGILALSVLTAIARSANGVGAKAVHEQQDRAAH